MDSLIAASARALAALKPVALRDDPTALALRDRGGTLRATPVRKVADRRCAPRGVVVGHGPLAVA